MGLPTHTFDKSHALPSPHAHSDLGICEWIAMIESPTNPMPKTEQLQDGKTAFFSRVKDNLFWD
jgi:hypothetical protein